MTILADGVPSPRVRGPVCVLMFSGDIGGGTLTVQRLVDAGDPAIDSDWVTLADLSSTAVYTTSPGGAQFDVKRSTWLRVVLTGSTNSSLEYTFNY